MLVTDSTETQITADERARRRAFVAEHRTAIYGYNRSDAPSSNMEMTNVVTVRKRRIFYQEIFSDHAEALEAVGLSE